MPSIFHLLDTSMIKYDVHSVTKYRYMWKVFLMLGQIGRSTANFDVVVNMFTNCFPDWYILKPCFSWETQS
jgi:hypothetical protein